MSTKELSRLEIRIPKELKKDLGHFCVANELSLRAGVELAISKLTTAFRNAETDAKGPRESASAN